MTRLSPNFTLAEATASAAATRIGAANQPPPNVLANMRVAAAYMQWVRHALGNAPVTVTSWYRAPAVNAAVGGSESSDHVNGWAIDFRRHGMAGLDVARVVTLCGVPFDQVIFYRASGVVHVSFAPAFRRQVFTDPGGGARRLQGLVA
jgi:zinc D-Ala-D-Ala carboxypeptidase